MWAAVFHLKRRQSHEAPLQKGRGILLEQEMGPEISGLFGTATLSQGAE